MEKFTILKNYTRKLRRFNLEGRTLEFKIKPIPQDTCPINWVKAAIEEVVVRGTEGAESTDLVGFTFCSKDFRKGDGWLRFKQFKDITFENIWDIISGIYQSNSTGFNTETFCLGVTLVKMPRGSGRGRRYNNFDEECAMRKGVVVIANKDKYCLPRALVVAVAHADKDPLYTSIRKDTKKLQTQRALALIQQSGVKIPEQGAGIPELELIQRHLKDYKLTVYRYGNGGRDVIFEAGTGKHLSLVYHEGHYNVITSLTAAFCCSYYCKDCHTPYDHKNEHRCGGTCPACQQSPVCPVEFKVKCDTCKRWFRSRNCYENHRKLRSLGKGSVCEQITCCEECLKTVRMDRKHFCEEIYCKMCRLHVPPDHQCFMQVDKNFQQRDKQLFIFYDLETRQEKLLEDNSLLHEPNLCVFKQSCDQCIESDTRTCFLCGVRLQVLKVNPIDRFVEYILNQRKLFKNICIISHNGGGYDNHFVLKRVLENTDLTPELIMRGTKLVLMTIGNVKFLDSLNYFPMALSKLPKVFGLTGFKKGYFPHLFNTLENQNYKGPIPAIEYYDPDHMKESERTALLEWHSEQVAYNHIFDFQNEIRDYCVSDVEILEKACLKFRKMMIAESSVCPFTEAATLPSACNKIFRRNFLKPDTIGIIPKNGYRRRDNQSKVATRWLLWEEKQREKNILHAAKCKESVVAGVKVDGYCPTTNQVFEFQGCYFHGCPSCYKFNRDRPTYEDPSDTLERRYESTLAKVERLKDLGYEVIEMWECHFYQVMKTTPEIEKYTDNHPLMVNTPLNPRDAFYGGRTGATKLFYSVKNGEKIRYVDVCSLYPWVNKYGKYPVGHPVVHIGDTCKILDLNKTEGLIKCKILPPRQLYHPVLPQKMNNKLMFVLCRLCGEMFNTEECIHSEEERALTGTWVMDEVRKAIEKGYAVLEIYEVWEYKTTQYDVTTKTGGLFTEYINKFLTIKQQASGWPTSCDTPEQKDHYIEKYFEKEGIYLDPKMIELNPGLRQLGKNVITSFWGKLGQRENQEKTSIVNDPRQFFQMLCDPSKDINTILPINENIILVNWCFKTESFTPLATVNVCLAAYTTAQARLKLYSYLEKLEQRVLYYDTDSVIYISRPGEYEVPLDMFLGEMTDELETYGSGSYITSFCSGGPKLYAYRVYSPEKDEYFEVCKVKGIGINHTISKQVNFSTLCNMVLSQEPPVYVSSRNIRRTTVHDVVTKEEQKIFRVNFKKRKIINSFDTVPYGYKKLKL